MRKWGGEKMKKSVLLLLPLAVLLNAGCAIAVDSAPWGGATEIRQTYSGQKVVYDARSGSVAELTSVLDRAGYLSRLNAANLFDTKIVIVLHGDTVPFFAIRNYAEHKALMQRAQSLSLGDVVEFRMCMAAARLQGFKPEDIHGFVKMVPMADAEIVRLQQEEGFAYMR
jgi:uncharacterized protein